MGEDTGQETHKLGYQCVVCTHFQISNFGTCAGGIDPENSNADIPQEVLDGIVTCPYIVDKNAINEIQVVQVSEFEIETDDMSTVAVIEDSGIQTVSLMMPACKMSSVIGEVLTPTLISNPSPIAVCNDCTSETGIVIVEGIISIPCSDCSTEVGEIISEVSIVTSIGECEAETLELIPDIDESKTIEISSGECTSETAEVLTLSDRYITVEMPVSDCNIDAEIVTPSFDQSQSIDMQLPTCSSETDETITVIIEEE